MPTRFSTALVFNPASLESSQVQAFGTITISAPLSMSCVAASGNSLSAQIMQPTTTGPSVLSRVQTSNDSPGLQLTSQPISALFGEAFSNSSLPKSQINTLE